MRGRVVDYDCPIEFSNGVLVGPGDIVFGDIDGVVIIPRAIEDEVIDAALEKVRGENMVRKLIEEGMPTRKVWDTYPIFNTSFCKSLIASDLRVLRVSSGTTFLSFC